MALLIVEIDREGMRVTRCDGLVEVPSVSVEQQAFNPRLGLICATRNLSELKQAITDTISDVTGQELKAETW